MYLYKPVPKLTSNENWRDVVISENMEKLVLVDKNAVNSIETQYVRETILEKLKKASEFLPENYSFVIFDAWRSNDVKNNPENLESPSLHMTGGAIGISIMDSNNELLNMGTDYDESLEKSRTRYYEELMPKGIMLSDEESNALNNRRLLFNILTRVGFVNYESKWWQYDYGNQFWGAIKSKDAIYGLIEF